MRLILLFFIISGLILIFLFHKKYNYVSAKDLYKFEGSFVKVKGIIKEISKTKTNKTKFKVCDDTGCFYIILPYNVSCKEIEAYGRVSEFKGKYYVFVYKKKDFICK